MRPLLTCLLLLVSLSLLGQKSTGDALPDSTQTLHSPRKATILAAVLPGAGQAYNKKYWKMPIVYAGLGTAAYFVHTNNQSYQRYRKALVAALDDKPETVNNTEYNTTQLDDLQEFYHRWRDISIFALAGVYVLQIIDANVDAHLFYFDVSEDLTLSILPSMPVSAQQKGGISLILKF